MVGRKGKEAASFNASVSSTTCSLVVGEHNSIPFQLSFPVIPNASPVPQASSSRFELFGTQLDDRDPVEDFVPHADVGIDDVQMVDEGTPVMALSSQDNSAVLALPSWNLVVGVFCPLIASSGLMSNSFMVSC